MTQLYFGGIIPIYTFVLFLNYLRMKKILVITVALMMGLFMFVTFQPSFSSDDFISEMMLTNIEALATPEAEEYYDCINDGNVDCPDGSKAEFVYKGYSLKLQR